MTAVGKPISELAQLVALAQRQKPLMEVNWNMMKRAQEVTVTMRAHGEEPDYALNATHFRKHGFRYCEREMNGSSRSNLFVQSLHLKSHEDFLDFCEEPWRQKKQCLT